MRVFGENHILIQEKAIHIFVNGFCNISLGIYEIKVGNTRFNLVFRGEVDSEIINIA